MGVNTCAKLQFATYSTAATAQVISMCKLACQLKQLFRGIRNYKNLPMQVQ